MSSFCGMLSSQIVWPQTQLQWMQLDGGRDKELPVLAVALPS